MTRSRPSRAAAAVGRMELHELLTDPLGPAFPIAAEKGPTRYLHFGPGVIES